MKFKDIQISFFLKLIILQKSYSACQSHFDVNMKIYTVKHLAIT